MGWRYQAKRVKAEFGDGYEYIVCEAFPDLKKDGDVVVPHTENVKFYGESPQDLAHWLRWAADDIEMYDVIIWEEEEDVKVLGNTLNGNDPDWPGEERMDIIGQNGNDGDHYEKIYCDFLANNC